VVVGELDLHGLTLDQAERRVEGFLRARAVRDAGGVVRIITGRGASAGRAPVIQGAVRQALDGWASEWVADWSVDAGGGAFLVRVRD
jgi:DNA-nicking Smr family endonuclease